MSPNNTPEIRDLLNDLHGYQHIKKTHLYFQMRKMTCTDISTDTIFDPFKREKSVFKVDYVTGWLDFVYTYANPGIEDIVLVSLSVPIELWFLASVTEVWGSERLRKPSGWEGEFLSF